MANEAKVNGEGTAVYQPPQLTVLGKAEDITRFDPTHGPLPAVPHHSSF